MERDELVEALLGTWTRHHDILMALLDAVPRGGMADVPTDGRGRDVARVFFHLDRVRRGWVHMHRTGERPELPIIEVVDGQVEEGGKQRTRSKALKFLVAVGKLEAEAQPSA